MAVNEYNINELVDIQRISQFLSDTENRTWAISINENVDLYRGRVDSVFLGQVVNSFKSAGISVVGNNIRSSNGELLDILSMISKDDILGVATNKYVELMTSSMFEIKLEEQDEILQEKLIDLLDSNMTTIKKAITQQSIAGEAFLKTDSSGKFIVNDSKYCSIIPAKHNADEVYAYVVSYPLKRENEFTHDVVAEIHTKEVIVTEVLAYSEENGLFSVIGWDEQTLGAKPEPVFTKELFGEEKFMVERIPNGCRVEGTYTDSDYNSAVKSNLRDKTIMETLMMCSLSKYIFPTMVSNVMPDAEERTESDGTVTSYESTFKDRTVFDEEADIKYVSFQADYKHNQDMVERRINSIYNSLSISKALLGDYSDISNMSGVSVDKVFYTTKSRLNDKWSYIENALVNTLNKFLSMNDINNKVLAVRRDDEIVVSVEEKQAIKGTNLTLMEREISVLEKYKDIYEIHRTSETAYDFEELERVPFDVENAKKKLEDKKDTNKDVDDMSSEAVRGS